MSDVTPLLPDSPSPLMDVEDTIIVDHPVVGCDGGGDPLGHPLVYLRIGSTREVVCPYCSRQFVLKEGAGAATEH